MAETLTMGRQSTWLSSLLHWKIASLWTDRVGSSVHRLEESIQIENMTKPDINCALFYSTPRMIRPGGEAFTWCRRHRTFKTIKTKAQTVNRTKQYPTVQRKLTLEYNTFIVLQVLCILHQVRANDGGKCWIQPLNSHKYATRQNT